MLQKERIDEYIKNSEPFAQPILAHIRQLVHSVCPKCEETIKWKFPHFDYKGRNICFMASFHKHCAIGFWFAEILIDSEQILMPSSNKDAMGNIGKILSLDNLPPDAIIRNFIEQSIKFIEEGTTLPKKVKAKKELIIPDNFTRFISKNEKAIYTFQNLSYSHQKEYLEWIEGAKTDSTRNKRLQTTLEWLVEGKTRHWKYAKSE